MWRKIVVVGLAAWASVQTAVAAAESAPAVAAQPVIVSSIKPVGWLVAELAPQQVAQQTIVPAGFSPHEYQLRPQDAAAISSADVVVWVGPAMEPWLVPQVAKLPAERQLALLPELRQDHNHGHHHDHDDHGHDEQEHHHDHGEAGQAGTSLISDPHLWLNPLAMKEAAVNVAALLSARYPQHQAEIGKNLSNFSARLTALDAELAQDFAPVAQTGFAVYHDAYSHLVARYQLNQVAAVWRHESVPPGAKARAVLLKQLADGEVACLFYEPEHGADQVDKWLGKNSIRYSEIDLLGQSAPAGIGGYETFMRAVSQTMTACLRQGQTPASAINEDKS